MRYTGDSQVSETNPLMWDKYSLEFLPPAHTAPCYSRLLAPMPATFKPLPLCLSALEQAIESNTQAIYYAVSPG